MMQYVFSDADGNVRALFGVLDGHSTKAASQFASEELPGFIERRLRVLDVQEKKLRTVEAPGGSFSIFSKERPRLVKEALVAAFLDADRFFLCESIILHLLNGGQPGSTRSSLERCFSGSCACVILIDRGTLYCANAGDCRAVLAVEVPITEEEEEEEEAAQRAAAQNDLTASSSLSGYANVPLDASNNRSFSNNSSSTFDTLLHYPDGRRSAIIASCLSNDHNTDNQRELARIRDAHPSESDLFASGRIKGILKPTRHIGGALLKEPIARRFIRGDSLGDDWNPPYTTSLPEVSYRVLTPADRFVIIASDGLWDLLSNQEAVSLVVEYDQLRRQNTIPSQLNVCTFIIERALARAALSKDYTSNNVTGDSESSIQNSINRNSDSTTNGNSNNSGDNPLTANNDIHEKNEVHGAHASSMDFCDSQKTNGNDTNGISHPSQSSQHPSSSSSSSQNTLNTSNTDRMKLEPGVSPSHHRPTSTLNASSDCTSSEPSSLQQQQMSELERLCTILSLPAHQRRDVYDDISVTVIYLDTGRREQAGTAMGALAQWACPSFPSSVDRISKLRKAIPLAKPLSRLLASGTSESVAIKQYLEECWPDRHLDRWTTQNLTTRKFLKSFGIELAPSNTPLHPSAAKLHQLQQQQPSVPLPESPPHSDSPSS